MNWRDEWSALSQRIRGLIKAGSVCARFSLDPSDPYEGSKELRYQSSEIFSQLQDFQEQFAQQLPSRARDSLERWLNAHEGTLKPRPLEPTTQKTDRNVVKAALPFLAAVESELTYHLADSQEQVRRRSERAFIHLQRLIAADSKVRQEWRDAFGKGEVSCEKIGAAHLLLHGIWAFKADATGARTDLVFQEPLTEFLPQVERAAEGLVLTEWKVARKPREIEERFEEAREQAQKYAGGALAGIELTAYRYAVVVSEHAGSPPEDLRIDGTVFRHINIAVDPKTPSKG